MENYEADDVIRNSISFHVRIIYIKLDDSKILTNEKWMFHHFHPFKTGCLGFQVAMLVCCRVDVHPQQFNTSPPPEIDDWKTILSRACAVSFSEAIRALQRMSRVSGHSTQNRPEGKKSPSILKPKVDPVIV